MSNIAIVNYCNLKCPYCFADTITAQDNKYISIENYQFLTDFILKNPNDRIGIIGGEPTLHPNFKDILIITSQLAKKNNKTFLLFTNGIKLKPYLDYLDNINVLINYNHPDLLSALQQKELEDTLNTIFNLKWFDNFKVILGCNIYLKYEQYNFFWDAVDKYNLKEIRCSVVSPAGIYKKYRNNKDIYFQKLKPIFLSFCEEARKRNCIIIMDCCHIPLCYFSDEELQYLDIMCDFRNCHKICNCVLDFTPDMKVTPCFGNYTTIDFSCFQDTNLLSNYLFNNYNKIIAKQNNQGKCINCILHKTNQCQGGCLAFSSPE